MKKGKKGKTGKTVDCTTIDRDDVVFTLNGLPQPELQSNSELGELVSKVQMSPAFPWRYRLSARRTTYPSEGVRVFLGVLVKCVNTGIEIEVVNEKTFGRVISYQDIYDMFEEFVTHELAETFTVGGNRFKEPHKYLIKYSYEGDEL